MEVALASSLHSVNIAFGAITGGVTDATQFFPHFENYFNIGLTL
jgi:hypothetical protein